MRQKIDRVTIIFNVRDIDRTRVFLHAGRVTQACQGIDSETFRRIVCRQPKL